MKSNILANKLFSLIIFVITFSTGLLIVSLSYKGLNLGLIPEICVQAQPPPCDPSDPCCEAVTIDPCICRNQIRCNQLSPKDLTPNRGEQVTFTCTGEKFGNARIDHFEFRVNVDGAQQGDITSISNSGNNSAQFTYTVSQEGDTFAVQCRVCSPGGRCSIWGAAESQNIPTGG